MSPETATYSTTVPADVVFTVTGAESITSIKKGASTVASSNYVFSGNKFGATLKFKKEYLATLSGDPVEFTIATDNGTTTATINLLDITPTTDTFSKADPADVEFTVTGAEDVTAVKNGTTALTDEQYLFDDTDGTLTIDATYLGTLDNGDVALTIATDTGTASVTITVGA